MPFLPFLRHNARWLAGGYLLTLFSSFGQTFFISLSAGGIRADYDLSHGAFGSIYMAATLLSAFTLPHLGRIVDYVSVSRVALLTMPMLAIAAVLMAVSHSLVLLFLAIYMLRLFGQGMMTHNAMTAMGRWFSAQRGRAVSLTTLGFQSGEAVLPLIFVSVVAAVGWRETWLMAAGIIAIVGLPAIYALMRVERRPSLADGPERRTAPRDWLRGEVLRDPVFWMALSGVFAPGFIGTTIYFNQVYLVELRGWSMEAFAGSFILSSSATVVCVLVCGHLIDRFSAVRILPYFLLPLAAACFVLGLVEAQWGIFVFMALLGMSNGFSTTLFGALWPEIYGMKHLGSIRSIIVAMLVFATAVGPGLTGVLIDIGVPYPLQIVAMGVYCLFAVFMLTAVRARVTARNALAEAG